MVLNHDKFSCWWAIKQQTLLAYAYTIDSVQELQIRGNGRAIGHPYPCWFTVHTLNRVRRSAYISMPTCKLQLIRPTLSFMCDLWNDLIGKTSTYSSRKPIFCLCFIIDVTPKMVRHKCIHGGNLPKSLSVTYPRLRTRKCLKIHVNINTYLRAGEQLI